MIEPYLPHLSESGWRWVRFLALLLVIGFLCWIAYRLRAVFTPILVAAAIAYILNPLVTRLEYAHAVPRLTTVIFVFVVLGFFAIVGGFYLSSRTIAQLAVLQERIPVYIQNVGDWMMTLQARAAAMNAADATTLPTATLPAMTLPATTTAVPEAAPPTNVILLPEGPERNWWRFAAPVLKEHAVTGARTAYNYVAATASNLFNLISLLVLIPVYTFFLLWRFNDIVQVIRDHLPARYRPTIVHVVTTIDASMASFFRGRLIVCLIVGAVTATGWSLVGVPYSLPLGMLAGVLNLVPFLSIVALPPALILAYTGAAEAGQPWFWPVVLTMGVHSFAQGLESFVLSPAIEGRASGLHPLIIVIVLLVGAQLAGLLGMLLAIPVTSTLRTLAAEWVLPEIRRLATDVPDVAAAPSTDLPVTKPTDPRA